MVLAKQGKDSGTGIMQSAMGIKEISRVDLGE